MKSALFIATSFLIALSPAALAQTAGPTNGTPSEIKGVKNRFYDWAGIRPEDRFEFYVKDATIEDANWVWDVPISLKVTLSIVDPQGLPEFPAIIKRESLSLDADEALKAIGDNLYKLPDNDTKTRVDLGVVVSGHEIYQALNQIQGIGVYIKKGYQLRTTVEFMREKKVMGSYSFSTSPRGPIATGGAILNIVAPSETPRQEVLAAGDSTDIPFVSGKNSAIVAFTFDPSDPAASVSDGRLLESKIATVTERLNKTREEIAATNRVVDGRFKTIEGVQLTHAESIKQMDLALLTAKSNIVVLQTEKARVEGELNKEIAARAQGQLEAQTLITNLTAQLTEAQLTLLSATNELAETKARLLPVENVVTNDLHQRRETTRLLEAQRLREPKRGHNITPAFVKKDQARERE